MTLATSVYFMGCLWYTCMAVPCACNVGAEHGLCAQNVAHTLPYHTLEPPSPTAGAQTIPAELTDTKFKIVRGGSVADATLGDLFADRKVVIFGVPGAFTPTCSEQHLPSFVDKAEEIKASGVKDIICVATNDAFVLKAWGESVDPKHSITFLADGNADFVRALNADLDLSGAGMGIRANRFAAIVENGDVTTALHTSNAGEMGDTGADAVLRHL